MISSIISTFTLLFVGLCLVDATRWKDCGSTAGKIKSLTVSSCPGSEKDCALKKGSNVTCTVTFVPNHDVEELKSEVKGIIKGVVFPFPLPNSDTCVDSGLTCPLKAEQTYTYKVQLYIRDMYPQIKVVVKWSLLDQKGDSVVCFVLPAEIVS